jgi:polyferredoxin
VTLLFGTERADCKFAAYKGERIKDETEGADDLWDWVVIALIWGAATLALYAPWIWEVVHGAWVSSVVRFWSLASPWRRATAVTTTAVTTTGFCEAISMGVANKT